MQRTQQVFLLCLCALVAGVAFAPSQANALDLQIPVQLDFTYDSYTTKAQEGNSGELTISEFEFGLQLPIIFKFHPKFGVGPAFRFSYTSDSSETSVGGATSKNSDSGYLIGLGLMLRSDVHEMFAIQFAGFYDLGKLSSDDGDAATPAAPDSDLSGLELRLDLLGRAKVGQYKTWFEIGPYFNYRSLTAERTANSTTTKTDISGFGLGLAIQGTFEFGI